MRIFKKYSLSKGRSHNSIVLRSLFSSNELFIFFHYTYDFSEPSSLLKFRYLAAFYEAKVLFLPAKLLKSVWPEGELWRHLPSTVLLVTSLTPHSMVKFLEEPQLKSLSNSFDFMGFFYKGIFSYKPYWSLEDPVVYFLPYDAIMRCVISIMTVLWKIIYNMLNLLLWITRSSLRINNA